MTTQPYIPPTMLTDKTIWVEPEAFESAVLEHTRRANGLIDELGVGHGKVVVQRTPGSARMAVEFSWDIRIKQPTK